MPIRRLPEELVNQIAAGEVVERPAAALRELVENALDAGAGRIAVELERGGKDLIVVADDGCGMSAEEIPLALERHATSKITSLEELHRVLTLGFRGEALPSIASVSKLRLTSRTADDEHAWEVQVEGGQIRPPEPRSAPPGTRVEVARLFYNTPARRKFLKADATELAHCLDFIGRVALVRPGIGFSVRHGRQVVFDAPPTADPAERAVAVLGTKARGKLFPLLWEGEVHGERLRWEGLIGSPELLAATTKSIHLFVEGRPIRDRSLAHAVQRAYREVIVEKKYPTTILNLRIDPEAVDVNIHPTKAEVRFRNPGAIYSSLLKALGSVLQNAPWKRGAHAAASSVQPPLPRREDHQYRIQEALGAYHHSRRPSGGWSAQGFGRRSAAVAPAVPEPVESPGSESERVDPATGEILAAPEPVTLRAPVVGEVPAEQGMGFFSQLELIGQFHNEYLVCQSHESLYLIDQHAAHERVAYEALRKAALSDGGKGAQMLLVPEVVEPGPARARAILDSKEGLERIGFELEDYGGNAIVVRAVPAVLAHRATGALLVDAADELIEHGVAGAGERAIEELCATMACHSVIRGATALSFEQAKALLARMDAIEFAAHCPHGRPVIKEFHISEIERLFKRTL